VTVLRVPPDLAAALHVLRIIRGWKQSELAAAAGVKPSCISDYEQAKKTPELRTISALLEVMGYPLAALDDARAFIRRMRLGVPPEADPAEAEQIAVELGQTVACFARAVLASRNEP
jgi:transcriptional regulator with XRE-family HTH domain